MDKPAIRLLAAMSFLVFAVFGVFAWMIPDPLGFCPWWLPFVAAALIPAIVGTALFIAMGKRMFDD